MVKDKIILINPGIHYQESVSYGMYPNTAVMIIATILKNAGFRVKVIDGRYQKIDDCVRTILGEIDDKTVFVGFSVMTVQVAWSYYVSKAIKSKFPDMKIVWGGVHPTLFPGQTVEDPAVDIVAVNDSATVVTPLAKALAGGGGLQDVSGICYNERSKVIINPQDQVKDDFTNVPFIEFSLIDHERYSRNNNMAIEEFYGGQYNNCRVYPIVTGLGCNYKCTFCINVILERKYRYREAGEIVERIKFLQKDYGADFIHPMDENFFINKRRAFEFLGLLEKEKINVKWRPQLRADYFNDNYINLDVAKRLERSGMVVAAMGVESASQEVLDRLRKQLKVEQIMKCADILAKTNIVPKMNFMVGLPDETEGDMMKTYQLAVKLRRMFRKSCVTISPFRPYPGSPLYDKVVAEYGYSPPSSLEGWARLSQDEFSEGRGYESFLKYKWIKSPKKLRSMQCLYDFIAWYQPRKDDNLCGKILNWAVFLQFRHNFYHLALVERYLYLRLAAAVSFLGRLIKRTKRRCGHA
jgi:radical SAM superfamily enzyme YgiQ (UPF0313 family)